VSPRIRPTAVLDASAVLAYLKREPGYEKVRNALEAGATISMVNLGEVYARVVASGQVLAPVAASLLVLGLAPEPFTESDARASAGLYPQTQTLGLSLGDRACLALGMRLSLPVLTTDRAWTDRALPVEVQLLR
jgi:ribonuclease VapC